MTAVTVRPDRRAPQGAAAGTGWTQRLRTAPEVGPAELRSDAAARFELLGLPTSRLEDWRFTPLGPVATTRWSAAGQAHRPTLAQADQLAMGDRDWHRLVFLNGRLDVALSRIGHLPSGVRLGSLARALEVDGRRLASYLGSVASFEQQAFSALNTALYEDGACLYVGAGSELDRPLELLFLTDPGAGGHSVHPRNLVVLGANARATVLETYRSLGDRPHFTNPVTEAIVGSGAHLHHIKLGLENEAMAHIGRIATRQDRDSRFTSLTVTLGGALHRNDIDAEMDGTGCEVGLNGLYMARGEQLLDTHTSIRHTHESCASREVYVGVLDDRSHGVFNGKVYVTPEAQKTDGKQTNRNLLLSDRARIDTKPQLEIFADDVKCTHGATVGKLDDIGVFYLQSRGIGEKLARKILTFAFAADVVRDLPFESVRRRIEALLMTRLDSLGKG